MKTAELSGAYLDYWTGVADGKPAEKLSIRRVPRTDTLICVYNVTVRYAPSTDPAKGMEIIERDKINIFFEFNPTLLQLWHAIDDRKPLIDAGIGSGETPLIAACRAKVAGVYGPEVPDIEVIE